MSSWADYLGSDYMTTHGRFAPLKNWKTALEAACDERGLYHGRPVSFGDLPETLIKPRCDSNLLIHPETTFTLAGELNYLTFADACTLAGYDSEDLPAGPTNPFDPVDSDYLWCCKRLLDACCRSIYIVGSRRAGFLNGVNVYEIDDGIETAQGDLLTAYGWGANTPGSQVSLKCNVSLGGMPFNNGSGIFPSTNKEVFFRLTKYSGFSAYYHPVAAEMTYILFPGNITNIYNILYSDQLYTDGNVYFYQSPYAGWQVESARCICGPGGLEFYDPLD